MNRAPTAPKPRTFGGKPILFGAELGKPSPPKAYLLAHFGIGFGRVNMLVARSGVGKTVIAQTIALAVAGDLADVFGLKIADHGRVLHLDYEMGSDLNLRYQRLARGLGLDLADIGEGLGVVSFPKGVTTQELANELAALCADLKLFRGLARFLPPRGNVPAGFSPIAGRSFEGLPFRFAQGQS
jgi:hypothetical protein